MHSSQPVSIVTGAASGIGQELFAHLLGAEPKLA